MKKILVTICLILLMTNMSFSQNLSKEEMKLYQKIMEYRKTKGLPIIPLSKSLTTVAQTHAKDLEDNFNIKKIKRCNMHSWSKKGNWTSCCYTSNHAKAKCMWEKPRELTSYKGNGYEICHWSSNGSDANNAITGWKKSKGHNAVMINKGAWKKKWNAIGIGINGNFATVWFGHEEDIE